MQHAEISGIEILERYASRGIDWFVFAAIMILFLGLIGYGLSGVIEVYKTCGKVSKAIVIPVTVAFIVIIGFVVHDICDRYYPEQEKLLIRAENNVGANELYEHYRIIEQIGKCDYIVVAKGE